MKLLHDKGEAIFFIPLQYPIAPMSEIICLNDYRDCRTELCSIWEGPSKYILKLDFDEIPFFVRERFIIANFNDYEE